MKKRFQNLLRVLTLFCFLGGAAFAHATPDHPEPPVKPETREGCCAYALQFVNLYESKYIKKIRVSGLCNTTICCANPDEWQQDSHLPEYVEWSPAGGGAVPYGSAIDNEFLIFLSSDVAPHNLQVEWFDLNDNIVCRHTIEISCDRRYDEDEDWTQYTSKTALNDDNLFVFAVREEDEDEEGCDSDEVDERSTCTIDASITCMGINTYHVQLTGQSGYNTYSWQVKSGPSTPGLASVINPTMDLSTPGAYIVALTAINTSSSVPDTCYTEKDIIIPMFTPVFTTSPIPNLCSTKIQFTAGGIAEPSTVANVMWVCAGKPDFPTTGNTVAYDFATPGTFSVTMTIMDIYGCAHTVTQSVTISNTCSPGVKIKEFVFCGNCTGTTSVPVTFENLSTGGKCPVSFVWEFGDGQTLTTNESQKTVTHTYNGIDCKEGKTFTLTLKMTDSSTPACVTSTSIQVALIPCMADFRFIVCPDGKVICEGNVKGTWDLPNSAVKAPWPYSSFPDLEGRQRTKVFRLPDGTFNVTFTGSCSGGGVCKVTKTIVVETKCCAKNDSDRKKMEFTAAGKEYRMKYKLVQRQLPLIHHIKVKTKLKKHKKIAFIWYWKGNKADEIEASHSGTIFKSTADCNCEVPEATSGSEINFNKAKAKYRQHINGKFRSRTNTLESTHRVVKDGTTVTDHCHLGMDCDVFRWWTDWF